MTEEWIENIEPIAEVNELQCASFVPILKDLSLHSNSEDDFSLRDTPRACQIRALIYLVSICHSINWDFLMGDLARDLFSLTHGFEAENVIQLEYPSFKRLFRTYRRSDGSVGYTRRLRNLKKIAALLSERKELINELSTDYRIASPEYVRSLLEELPVYNEDPLRKKLHVLIKEFVKRRLVMGVNLADLEPAIDYHIMRLYLRTGRITIRDGELLIRLVHRRPVRIEQITKLRAVVSEAIKYTSWISDIPVAILNDLEWLFARSACRRNDVQCLNGRNCEFASWCFSAFKNIDEMVTEPRSRHGHY